MLTDADIKFYTGLPNRQIYISLFQTCVANAVEQFVRKNDNGISREHKLRFIDEYLLVLVRPRLGLLLRDLAYRFRISASLASRTLSAWITYNVPIFCTTIHCVYI